MSSSELSPRAAIVLGLIVIVLGVVPILGVSGILRLPLSQGVPGWVGIAAGLTFVLAGIAVIVGYAIAGVDIDDTDADEGRYEIGVSFRVRLAQYILAISIYGLFAAIAGWIALGKGPRAFSETLHLPWLARFGAENEWLGRVAFGLGALACAAAGIATAVKNFRKLKRP